ncbi:MAG: SDR family oxidoreductase [Kiritimatiellae bacterium]|nr:SDR family oxidoreductase [Kiritimatiellia bacterium]
MKERHSKRSVHGPHDRETRPVSVVTGGAGFLGPHLCDFLLEQGHRVVCLDNLITGNVQNIEHLAGNDAFRFIKHDVTEYIYLPGAVDYIFHFASPASPIDYLELPIQTLKVGALGTHKALGLARAKRAAFLLASTSEVYGDPLVHPQNESYWGNVNPIGPRGVYDEAKRYAEAITMAYHRFHGVNTKIVRIFNTYGPRMRPNDGRVVPTFIVQCLRNKPITLFGDGGQTRSFCYVADLIRGIYLMSRSKQDGPVNLGNPDEMSIAEFAMKIRELTGSRSEIVYKPLPVDDPKVRRPDITKAKDVLGWKPEIGLEEGLARTIEYFRSQQGDPAPAPAHKRRSNQRDASA